MNKETALDIIYRAIDLGAWSVEKVDDGVLFGEGGLDSMGIVSFILDVEHVLGKSGHNIVLMDDRAMSRKRSPFLSVGGLASYIVELTDESG